VAARVGAVAGLAEENGIDPEIQPEHLRVRITYFTSGPITEMSAPYCDFAVPIRLER
jgi:hypothetical protein